VTAERRSAVPHDRLLGRIVTLPVRRFGAPGAFLALDPDDTRPNAPLVLLPRAEVPEGAREGHEVEVFVYLDSEDRPIATTRPPRIVLGEVAFLEVVDLAPFGAFVDWGLPKQLLVPLAEQTRELRVGDRHPVGLHVDPTGRLAGTMRVGELLHDTGEFTPGEWVEGEAWRKEPGLGVFVIVERAFVGLLPESEPHELARGEAVRLRVAQVLPDGKIELSLRAPAHEEIEADASRILAVLSAPGAPRISERWSPEQIRARFGLSKKAFKRAIGRLLRDGSVRLDETGAVRLSSSGARDPRRAGPHR
jgi:predicted RNA-binding protein (virulence factor B family)